MKKIKNRLLTLQMGTVSRKEIPLVSQVTWKEPSLTFRPYHILLRSYKKQNLIAARTAHGTLAGWIEIYPITNTCWGISTLFVYPTYRGQGLGERLLEEAVGRLAGYEVLTATAHQGIISFFLRRGFAVTDTRYIAKNIVLMLVLRRYLHPFTLYKYLFYTHKGLCFLYRPLSSG